MWRTLWKLGTRGRSLAVTLLLLALLTALLLVIPQSPPTSPSTSQWLAQVQARLGPAVVRVLEGLSLFTLGRSPLLRVLLSVLAFLLLIRAFETTESLGKKPTAPEDEDGEAWQPLAEEDLEQAARRLRRAGLRVLHASQDMLHAGRWPVAQALALLAHVGPLLLLLGLLVGTVWGWRVEGLIGSFGETVSIPDHGEIALPDRHPGMAGQLSAVRLYPQGTGPEVSVVAVDETGEPLGLLLTPTADAVPTLRFRLGSSEDAYFAINQAGLFVRILPDAPPPIETDSALQVQILRIRSGELVHEATIAGDETIHLEELSLQFTRSRYLTFTVARDPGFGLKIAGIVVGALALLGRALWPPRRAVIRREASQLAGRGALPPSLLPADARPASRARVRLLLRLLTGALAPIVGGLSLVSILNSGLVWSGSQVQATLAVVWFVTGAAWLAWESREGE